MTGSAERIRDRRAPSVGCPSASGWCHGLRRARRSSASIRGIHPRPRGDGRPVADHHARRDLVEVAIRSGRLDEARQRNRASLAETHVARAPTQFAAALEDLATIEVREDRLARALRLAGAAAGVKERAGGGAPPPLVTVADVKAEATGRLPVDKVERYWEEGRALDDDAAYELANGQSEDGA